MSQHEKSGAKFLTGKGIEHYLPLVSRKRKWSDRIKMVDFPLFPGYLFVRIDWQEESKTVFLYPGIRGCLRTEQNHPAVMPDDEIESLKILERNTRELAANPIENFKPGEEVLITYGPLKGLKGKIEKVKNGMKVCVLIPLLNQMVTAQFDSEDLEKVLV